MIDQFARTSEPRIFAAGNVLHPVETAGWSWREGRRVAEFVAADLAGRLPPVKRTIKLTPGEGVRYVVPQRLVPGSGGLAYLQLRAADDVTGALIARCRGKLDHDTAVDVRAGAANFGAGRCVLSGRCRHRLQFR